MAKLKIFENNDPVADIPSKQGYINVATNLITNYNNFTDNSTTDQDRADLLQGYAGQNHIVYQLTRATPSDAEDDVAIDRDNCRVKLELDERKKGKGIGTIGKHNVALPKLEAGDPQLSTGYLSKYVKAIDELYGTGTTPEVEEACKFLFGLMLIGRCR